MESPLVVLRLDLERQRRAGIAFPVAWEAAVETALSSEPSRYERQMWGQVLPSTRSAWARAYVGVPAGAGALACEWLAAA